MLVDFQDEHFRMLHRIRNANVLAANFASALNTGLLVPAYGTPGLTARLSPELLSVAPLSQQQRQGRLAHCPLGRGLGSREQLLVMLRDEAGVNVARLELWVARQVEQEVDVGAESHNLAERGAG